MILEGYEPESVFKYFEEICMIPHGSHNTKGISDFVVNVAKENGLDYYQDDYNNVIVYKDGVGIGADKPAVILQGHLDMVCEKNFETDAKFDFSKDPLNLAVMDDYVYAKGTTLGGDDGIGVAYMLAVLTDKNLIAPPLECVFTSEEEVGMDGAHALDVSKLKGKRFINLDHDDEGVILTSCAGGKKVCCNLPIRFVEREENYYLLAENGKIIFLNRDITNLPVEGRPISKAVPIERIYKNRLPEYKAWADMEIDIENKTEDEIIKEIMSC